MTQVNSKTLPLSGRHCAVAGEGVALDYARSLLGTLGASVNALPGPAAEHPALAFARSGLMALTGAADGEPVLCPLPLAACADGVIAALNTIAARPLSLRGAALLTERAAAAGLRRAGAIAPGGSCRLLHAADGWLALNLARADDWSLLPAWLETGAPTNWDELAALLPETPVNTLVERGRLLGLAVSAMRTPTAPVPWYTLQHRASDTGTEARTKTPLVVDLSALWAGPLCGHLLQQLGARVVKVESARRPDGARQGPRDFYDLLNADKASVALDFQSAQGREQLRQLLSRADIVIEASRPRALRQLGINAQTLIDENPTLTWISITGYGREEPQAGWIAFGDDAGVAAGLSNTLYTLTGQALFCGDAIADPLTGLHAALLAWSSFISCGGNLLALALRDVVAHCAQFDAPASPQVLRERQRHWLELLRARAVTAAPPGLRRPARPARALGADTQAVLRELGISC